jgi:hypothetical protein
MPRSLGVLLTLFAFAIAAQAQTLDEKGLCDSHPQLCTEKQNNVDYAGNYVGHDEPSLLFYSNKKGSGNNNLYFITLPKDPPTFPNQAGTAGTANFQLRPAFWFGMAMCDSQSSPNFTNVCNPDSDANIFDNPNPHAADYIGHHPGVAFMEMQFYPPGWVLWPAGNSCDAFMWCAALNIDSLSEKVTSTGTQFNNLSCRNNANDEYVNFAFLTKDGVAQDAADPQNGSSAKLTADPSKAFFMNPGDRLVVIQRDTPAGFTVEIWDLSTGAHGSMTASIANGFAQLQFDPSATSCTSLPYAFHPMYATSSEHTRVTWAAHSYNVAFSDEIGHFEYCSTATGANFYVQCPAGGGDPSGTTDADDNYCFGPGASSFYPIGGCFNIFTGGDTDFDGPEYGLNWPGTLANAAKDHALHAEPTRFTSPLFAATDHDMDTLRLRNYSRVAFETDLPAIQPAPGCSHITGVGCANPPVPGSFYPIYTTIGRESCVWQEGGALIPDTINTFGGTSTSEYGPLLLLTYPSGSAPGSFSRYEDFRQVLNTNPCTVSKQLIEEIGGSLDDSN